MRQFNWCRQELAETCQWAGEHSHIIITTPGYRRIMPSCRKTSLRLFFHDLYPDKIKKTPYYAQNPESGQKAVTECFTEEQAQQIVQFVRSTDENELIVVNCEAGISRSPAVVMALRKFQGEDIEIVYKKAWPNIHVANTLGRVLGVGPFEEPKATPGEIVNPFEEPKS